MPAGYPDAGNNAEREGVKGKGAEGEWNVGATILGLGIVSDLPFRQAFPGGGIAWTEIVQGQ